MPRARKSPEKSPCHVRWEEETKAGQNPPSNSFSHANHRQVVVVCAHQVPDRICGYISKHHKGGQSTNKPTHQGNEAIGSEVLSGV